MAGFEKVLIVGHCGADTSSLTWLVSQVAPNAKAVYVGGDAVLSREISEKALVLVNRVLEGSFNAEGGIELIEELAKKKTGAGLMLISNYADAQKAAREVGAMAGFGKSEMGSARVKEMMKGLLKNL
jgi:two-component system, chemotaxis family, chemotaxis protein CheY